jgi:hypothetical protein
MKSLVLTPEIEAIARRVIWFEEPQQAIADPIRFLAYAMTYGVHSDIETIRGQLSESDLQEAIAKAPAGIFDARSWAYWNLMLGRFPTPPLPQRKLE